MNGLKFFKERFDFPAVKYACIGQKTAELLRKNSIEPLFIGQGTDMHQIAETFRKLCTGQSVAFYGSQQSRKFIQDFISDSSTVYDIPIYQSIKNTLGIEDADFYVFTSSLNVEAFFECNSIPSDSEVWAIGEVTKQRLLEHGIENVEMPVQSSTDMIIETILNSSTTQR